MKDLRCTVAESKDTAAGVPLKVKFPLTFLLYVFV